MDDVTRRAMLAAAIAGGALAPYPVRERRWYGAQAPGLDDGAGAAGLGVIGMVRIGTCNGSADLFDELFGMSYSDPGIEALGVFKIDVAIRPSAD